MAGRERLVINPLPKGAFDLSGIKVVTNKPEVAKQLTDSEQRIADLQKIIMESRKKEAEAATEEREKINKWKLEKRFAEIDAMTGGYKNAKDKYTVKELKTIASRNNIKTTKKLNGKTVPLNKKGLVAKLKRNKVI